MAIITSYTIGHKTLEMDRSCALISVCWIDEQGSNRVNIPVTPTELMILQELLNSSCCKEADLDDHIYQCRSAANTRIRPSKHSIAKKHIANLRPKLRAADLDIFRIINYGYILNDIAL